MTTAKERMLEVLSGRRLIPPPVVFHSWGGYKIQLAGWSPKFQHYLGGEELAYIEMTFYQRFRPDWLHLGSAGWRGYWNRPRKCNGDNAFIASSDGSKWIEILDDYSLSDYADVHSIEKTPVPSLESMTEIDEYFSAITLTEDQILESGRFEHVAILAKEIGGEVLIAVNDGAPGSWIHGWRFEDMVIACVEKPDLVEYFIYKDCERFLTDVRAAKRAGADAYIFSEGFAGSLDNISPEMHERLEGNTKRWFYSQVRKIGMIPIGYWLGDVRPNMPIINGLDIAGLMIEESKKTFQLDPVEIRKILREDICLFGNIDSALLLWGTPAQIQEIVKEHLKVARYGTFVLANGSPLIPGTPTKNLDAYMRAAGR